MPYASMIAVTRRQHQRLPKTNGKSTKEVLRAVVARLPEELQPGLVARMNS
ncbi:hypothetical protein [Jannaschia seosinensis]|nr:hypothetical protein [Jannaschia seosinensis]